MSAPPLAHRSLWALVLVAALAAVVVNFVREPLQSAGEIPLLGSHFTLWVPDGHPGAQSRVVAEQAAGYWQVGDRTATVGVLHGRAAAAVQGFLHRDGRSARARENLLVLTSTTLSDIAQQNPPGAGSGGAERLLARAPLVAVLASDPLALVVRASSPIHRVTQLIALARGETTRTVFGVAEDPWLTANLASVVVRAGLHRRVSYTAFDSSQAAVAGVEAGTTAAALVPRSALTPALASHQVRVLRWPGGAPPRAWVALAAPPGVPAAALARLRAQARHVARDPAWRRLLRSDGITPVGDPAPPRRNFLRDGARKAARLQALAARVIAS